jgi:hypothetical protein
MTQSNHEFCVRQSDSTAWPLQNARGFGVIVLGERQDELAQRFATSGIDRFGGVRWLPGPAGCTHLAGARTCVDRAQHLLQLAGDHVPVVGGLTAHGEGPAARPMPHHAGRLVTLPQVRPS